MSDAIKLAIDALESCTDGDYSTGHVIPPDFDRAMVDAALAALRAQHVPETNFGNIAQPAAPFKKLSDNEVLWIAQSHGITQKSAGVAPMDCPVKPIFTGETHDKNDCSASD